MTALDPTLDEAHDAICLITGATRGLGRAVAEEMARRGTTVVVTGRDTNDVGAAVEEIRVVGGAWAAPNALDVTVRSEVDAAADAVGAQFGRLDILINNAAAFVDWSESASTADLDRSRVVMDTNLYGPWNMIQAFLPLLQASPHPRIVNIGSGGGSHGDSQFGLSARHGAAATYGVSKAGLHALTIRSPRRSSVAWPPSWSFGRHATRERPLDRRARASAWQPQPQRLCHGRLESHGRAGHVGSVRGVCARLGAVPRSHHRAGGGRPIRSDQGV